MGVLDFEARVHKMCTLRKVAFQATLAVDLKPVHLHVNALLQKLRQLDLERAV